MAATAPMLERVALAAAPPSFVPTPSDLWTNRDLSTWATRACTVACEASRCCLSSSCFSSRATSSLLRVSMMRERMLANSRTCSTLIRSPASAVNCVSASISCAAIEADVLNFEAPSLMCRLCLLARAFERVVPGEAADAVESADAAGSGEVGALAGIVRGRTLGWPSASPRDAISAPLIVWRRLAVAIPGMVSPVTWWLYL